MQERFRDLHLPLVTHSQPVVASHTKAMVFNGPNDLEDSCFFYQLLQCTV